MDDIIYQGRAGRYRINQRNQVELKCPDGSIQKFYTVWKITDTLDRLELERQVAERSRRGSAGDR